MALRKPDGQAQSDLYHGDREQRRDIRIGDRHRNIEPVIEVEVGTQVSGIIDKIYVDYNAAVTKGQLIAEMDRVTLQSELASQRATYNGAKAEYDIRRRTMNAAGDCTKGADQRYRLRAVALQL